MGKARNVYLATHMMSISFIQYFLHTSSHENLNTKYEYFLDKNSMVGIEQPARQPDNMLGAMSHHTPRLRHKNRYYLA